MDTFKLLIESKQKLQELGIITVETMHNDRDEQRFVFSFECYKDGEFFCRHKGLAFKYAESLEIGTFLDILSANYHAVLRHVQRKIASTPKQT